MYTIAERRYAELRQAGFLKSEAKAFRHIKVSSVPYMRAIIKHRKEQHDKFMAQNRHLTADERIAEWDRVMIRMFQRNGWVKQRKSPKTDEVKTVVDPWKELRIQEDRYKDKNRQYESPHVKRQRDFAKFAYKLDKALSST